MGWSETFTQYKYNESKVRIEIHERTIGHNYTLLNDRYPRFSIFVKRADTFLYIILSYSLPLIDFNFADDLDEVWCTYFELNSIEVLVGVDILMRVKCKI